MIHNQDHFYKWQKGKEQKKMFETEVYLGRKEAYAYVYIYCYIFLGKTKMYNTYEKMFYYKLLRFC